MSWKYPGSKLIWWDETVKDYVLIPGGKVHWTQVDIWPINVHLYLYLYYKPFESHSAISTTCCRRIYCCYKLCSAVTADISLSFSRFTSFLIKCSAAWWDSLVNIPKYAFTISMHWFSMRRYLDWWRFFSFPSCVVVIAGLCCSNQLKRDITATWLGMITLYLQVLSKVHRLMRFSVNSCII